MNNSLERITYAAKWFLIFFSSPHLSYTKRTAVFSQKCLGEIFSVVLYWNLNPAFELEQEIFVHLSIPQDLPDYLVKAVG